MARCLAVTLDNSTVSGVTRCVEDEGHPGDHWHPNYRRTVRWDDHGRVTWEQHINEKGDSGMKENWQYIDQAHRTDGNGNPAGGATAGLGIAITWQDGPLNVDGVRREPNGAFVEGVIEAAIGRIEFYQRSKFHGIHNAIALDHLYAALEVLQERTRDREARGVEGTHKL